MRVHRGTYKKVRVVSFDQSLFKKYETINYLREYFNRYNNLKIFDGKEVFITVFETPYKSKELENEILKRLIDTLKVNRSLERDLLLANKTIEELLQLIEIINHKDEEIKKLRFELGYIKNKAIALKKYKIQIEKIEHSRAKSRDFRRKNEPGKPGRPRANIDMQKVMEMKAQGMKDSQIAKHFGVARSTMCKYVKNCV